MTRSRIRIALLVTALAALLAIIWNAVDEFDDASYFKKLSVEINGHGNSTLVRAYYDENHNSDAWYIFLPSCADLTQSPVHFSGADHLEIEDINGTVVNIKNGGYLTELNRDETYLIRFVTSSGYVAADGKFVYMQSENLPSAFISTESGSMEYLNQSKKNEEQGSMTVFTTDGTVDFTGALDMIRGHGNTSWRLDKRPYQIKIHRTGPLLGMKSARSWLLIANYLDVSKIRNLIVNGMAEAEGLRGTTDSVMTDVYFNGEYAGMYQLSEKVEIDPSRLDITDLEDENRRVNLKDPATYETTEIEGSGESEISYAELDHTPMDYTGGYLIERNYVERYSSRPSRFKTESGERYVVRSPAYASKTEVEYIAGVFQRIEDKAASGDGSISDLIDLQSFADKYVLEEFVKNEASGSTSSFFYKDADSVDPLIYAGPAWDFDKTLSNGQNDTIDAVRTITFNTNHKQQTMLFYDLYMKNDEFRALVKKSYEEKVRPYAEGLLNGKLDELTAIVSSNNNMDGFRWHDNPAAIEEDTEKVRTFLKERMDFCDDIWLNDAEIAVVHFTGDNEDRDPYIGVIKGETLTALPGIPSEAGKGAHWINKSTGEEITEDTVISGDIEACVGK